jgi:hypothetical protein
LNSKGTKVDYGFYLVFHHIPFRIPDPSANQFMGKINSRSFLEFFHIWVICMKGINSLDSIRLSQAQTTSLFLLLLQSGANLMPVHFPAELKTPRLDI